jgi:hypothetical protein
MNVESGGLAIGAILEKKGGENKGKQERKSQAGIPRIPAQESKT